MTLKYSLTDQQEQKFWASIAADLASKLSLPENRKKWQLNHRKAIDDAMRKSLYELCESNSEAAGACNLFENHKELNSGQRSFLSTIHAYFSDELPKSTHDYNKHRFAFFITGKSANEYIEEKGILDNEEPDFSTSPGSLSTFSPAELEDKVLESYLSPLINRVEFYAYKIQKELDRYPDQEPLRQFRHNFTELHQKVVTHFSEKRDIQTGIIMFLSIYDLASKTFFQKEDGGEANIFNELGDFGTFYLRDESISGTLKKYLAYSDSFTNQIEVFREVEGKSKEDYSRFFQCLLSQYDL